MIGPILLIATFYVLNVITNQHLAYYANGTWVFSWISGITNSPSGKYSAAIQSSGLQGVGHSVRVARRFSLWPMEVMETATEDFSRNGPEKSTLALIWTPDESAVALINHGWLVDYYNLSTKRRDPWGQGLYLSTDTNALASYHYRILEALGAQTHKQIFQKTGDGHIVEGKVDLDCFRGCQ